MFDSGGSSGQLRDELGVLPPGDVLKCALALSRNEGEAQTRAAVATADARASRAARRPHRRQPPAVDDGAAQRRLSRRCRRAAEPARLQGTRVAGHVRAGRRICAEYATAHRRAAKSKSMPASRAAIRCGGSGSTQASRFTQTWQRHASSSTRSSSGRAASSPASCRRCSSAAYGSDRIGARADHPHRQPPHGRARHGWVHGCRCGQVGGRCARPAGRRRHRQHRASLRRRLTRYAAEHKEPLELGRLDPHCEAVLGEFWRTSIARHDRRRLSFAVWSVTHVTAACRVSRPGLKAQFSRCRRCPARTARSPNSSRRRRGCTPSARSPSPCGRR